MANYSKKSLGPIEIVGIPLRTTNDDGRAMQDIPPFWEKFHQEKILEQIPNKVSDDVYAVYTQFENEGKNNQGMYTMVLGAAVTSVTSIPHGMMSIVIPYGAYAVFAVEKGDLSSIGKTWYKIWQLSKDEPSFDAQKTYYAEFEHHQTTGDIDVYIGLKKAIR